jgi:hypothetical protein
LTPIGQGHKCGYEARTKRGGAKGLHQSIHHRVIVGHPEFELESKVVLDVLRVVESMEKKWHVKQKRTKK